MTDLDRLQQDLAAQGVRYVFGAYTDVHGVPKSKCVPITHLKDAAAGSELYTVGALDGMGELGPNEDECAAIPDWDQVTVLPWDRRYAVAPANLYFHGEPYSHDFRRILQNQIADAASLGFRMNMGVEPELYVLRETEHGARPWIAEDTHNLPTRGYDLETTILADAFLEPMVGYMNELGWDVYSFDHEGGDGQYEFDFGYTDALAMADRMLIFRLMAKHVARTLGALPRLCRSRSRIPSVPGPISMSAWPTSAPAVTSSTAAWPASRSRRRPGRRCTARSPISSPPGCWRTGRP